MTYVQRGKHQRVSDVLVEDPAVRGGLLRGAEPRQCEIEVVIEGAELRGERESGATSIEVLVGVMSRSVSRSRFSTAPTS